jgi:hypothetical protein
MGVLAQAGMNATTTATPGAATEAYEFLSEQLTLEQEIIRTDGLRGTRLHPTERTRTGRRTPGGNISLQPTVAELTNLLPRIVSGSAGTFTVSDTVPPAFQVIIDRVAKVVTYTGCRVSKARFYASAGSPLTVDLDIEALDHSIGNAGTFAALTIDAHAPYIFEDATLTLGGTTYQFMDWECTIDWHLKLDRWVNSVTRTDLPSEDCTVTVKFALPYTSDTTGLYNVTPGAGVAGVVTFSNGGHTLVFTYADLLFPALKEGPAVRAKDEILLPLQGEARRTGSSGPLVITTT